MRRITNTFRFALLSATVASMTACLSSERNEPTADETHAATNVNHNRGGSEWLRGDMDTRFALVAKHLRGFDMAMVEVGYRYTELHWASRDQNWEYAAYQLGKIETAVDNGVERRPRRAASARMLEDAIARVRAAIDERDGQAVNVALETLTATCNACHVAERVPFITVAPPTVRQSPARLEAPHGGQEEEVIQ